MDNKKKLMWIALVLILIMFAFFFVLFKLISENSVCVSNPLLYTAENFYVNTRIQENSLFTCSVEDIRFFFDKNGVYSVNPYFEPIDLEIGFDIPMSPVSGET